MSTVFENCKVSPPPSTVVTRSLPLTFFDMIWLLFFPIHQVFFYNFPHSRDHFLKTIVPNLKHSLSITLKHFFPFAGNLIVSPNPTIEKKPEIRYVDGDSVDVTFSECNLDFNDVTGNHPRNCDMFYQLVPLLGRVTKVPESEYVSIPVFSIQVTLFPNSGIAIGLTNHHSLCDATTRFNFLKAWSSIATHGSDESFLGMGSLPLYDRVIKYPSLLDEIYLSQPGIEVINAQYQPPQLVSQTDKVRATIVLTQAQINRLKKWLSTEQSTLEYISSFLVVCAFVWSSVAKSCVAIGEKKSDDDDLERFICGVDWKSRMDPPIPQTYFGNCIGGCFSTPIKTTMLAGEKGFVIAAEVFGKVLSETIKNKDGMLKDAETWPERAYLPVPTIGVSGTPKTKVYDIDFGWGKPKKHETISIDYNGAISINASRESPVDIEIGLSLPAKQMDAFNSICKSALKSYICEQE